MTSFFTYNRNDYLSSFSFFHFGFFFLTLISSVQKINMLELEKSSSNQNLDDLVTVATKQNICAREKFAEVSLIFN